MDRVGRELSNEASYDGYVKGGVDRLGKDEFGTAVAHFVERSNAVALKRRPEEATPSTSRGALYMVSRRRRGKPGSPTTLTYRNSYLHGSRYGQRTQRPSRCPQERGQGTRR